MEEIAKEAQQDGDVVIETAAPSEEAQQTETQELEQQRGKPDVEQKLKRIEREYADERERRKYLETRLEVLERQGQRLQPEQQKEQYVPPGKDDLVTGQALEAALESRLSQYEHRQKVTEQSLAQQWRKSMIEEGTKRYGEEYRAAFNALDRAALQNPSINHVVSSDKDPVEFIYLQGKRMLGEPVTGTAQSVAAGRNRQIADNDQHVPTLTKTSGGTGSNTGMSYEKLAAMDYAEYKKVAAKIGKEGVEKLKSDYRKRTGNL